MPRHVVHESYGEYTKRVRNQWKGVGYILLIPGIIFLLMGIATNNLSLKVLGWVAIGFGLFAFLGKFFAEP